MRPSASPWLRKSICRRRGRAVPAGAYVGHEPSQPSQPAPPHRLVETGTRRYQGNGSQPQSIPPWPPSFGPTSPRGVVPGVPTVSPGHGAGSAPLAHGTGVPRCARPRRFCVGSLHSGHSAERPPLLPPALGFSFMRPSPSHHHGIRQELPALFPAFAAKALRVLRGCPGTASAGPSPTSWGALVGFLGGGEFGPAALVWDAGRGDEDMGMGWGRRPNPCSSWAAREVGTPLRGNICWGSLSKPHFCLWSQ